MRTWVEINSENLKYNIKKLREYSNGKKILGVIKANGYGLGATKIAKVLEESGINFFGLATLTEAIEIQEIQNENIKAQILILSTLFNEEIEEATKRGFQINISNMEQLEFLKENKLKPKIHLKVDTGMTRLGFSLNEIKKAINYCKENELNLVGIFSHLSVADGEDSNSKNYTLDQIEKFKDVLNLYDFEYTHISNSAGLINFPEKIVGNTVRIGIAMYGFMNNKKIEGFKNVFTLKSRILFTKEVKEEAFVSYGRHFKLEKEDKYGVIPLGYYDGLKKYLSKGGYMEINNEKCEIIGNICMDMTMIKLPKSIKDKVKIGDEVKILDMEIIDNLDIRELCVWSIMTGLGRRVERCFI